MKYRCLPVGVCSWDFRIMRDHVVVATTSHDWLTEQGSIEVDRRPLDVVKHGVLTGAWSIKADGESVATADKPNAFTRRFELKTFDRSYELVAVALSRRFDLEEDGTVVASIAPDHPLTRRSSIQADESVPVEVLAFAFWLAVLCWKRAARSS